MKGPAMNKLLLAATMLAPLVAAAPAAALSYDPAAGFSTASNPNGAYSYGYSATLGGALTLFTDANAVYPNSWSNQSLDQYLGVYGATPTASSVSLHPGPNGQYSVIRVAIADTGAYSFNGGYSNGNNATTDVHVLVNGVSAFDGLINGQGSTSGFSFDRVLAGGSTVDFVVGPNGDYFFDSTNLTANIAAVPEPATWGLMLVGFGMVGTAARRRRPVAALA
jgi:hypothetical protein